jgi:Uncharacterized protein conserved in bacteria
MFKKLSVALLATALLGLSGQAHAETQYPNKPVTLVVPFTPGGLTDVLGRLIANQLSEKWGTSVVVENKPGGGSSIGAASVAQSKPDGHTVLKGSVGMVTNPFLMKRLPYEPDSLVPVALVGTAPLVLVVNSNVPVKSVADMKEHAKANGPFTFASSGNGSSPHITAEMFSEQSGIEIIHVPYKGTAPALNDLIGGQVAAAFDTRLTEPYLKEGRLRAIAVASKERLPALPDVPTFAEAGLPNMQAASWFGYFVPKGTPEEIRKKLADDIVAVASKPEIQKRIYEIGLEPTVMGTEEFTRFLESEKARWGGVIQSQGVSIN